MTPCCDTCQLDLRPGEAHDSETWEREGVLRCIPCAREFAQIRQFIDGPGAFDALEDALASPLAAEIDARMVRYPMPNGKHLVITSVPGNRSQPFQEAWLRAASADEPTTVRIHSRSRPHG
jgi:hypothetical protein